MPQLNPEFFVSQLFWLVVSFSFLLVFLWRISLPRIESVLDKRERKINDDISAAKKLQEEAEEIQKKIDEQLQKARLENNDFIKNTSISLQEKIDNELDKIEKNLDKKIEESENVIKKNKNESIEQIYDQIQEITRLTLSKISNFQVTNDEIRDVVSKIERKIN